METNLDNFKKYCERNQNTFIREGDYSEEHNILVEKILRNPMLIELKGIEFRYKEVKLIDQDKTSRCIDLIFIDNKEIPYICEVKASFRPGRGIGTQLEKYYSLVRDNFGIIPTRVGIQLAENGKLRKRIIPAEIGDLLRLDSKDKGGCQNETRIF
jgi:hypothetical protein